jgi:hypothetical protein
VTLDACPSVVDIAAANATLSQLVELAMAAGLVDTLSDGTDAITVLAPTDGAFAGVDAATLAALAEDTEALTKARDSASVEYCNARLFVVTAAPRPLPGRAVSCTPF